MKADLCNHAGRLITEVTLPPFPRQPPEVLVWRGRAFTWTRETARGDGNYQYRETTSYTIES